jgi:alkanesulfonate monooxygenase SsuD/methylene tetrahydromethanopterin reductase-like flavin-dependent oxidoreductase (luciferase family)
MANHGIDPIRRWDALREKSLALKALWTHDEASFSGDLVHFGPVWQWPKPVQRPHPPILIGGEGPGVLRRVVEYGDGWIPNWERETLERVAELNRLAAQAGRDPLPVTVYAAPPDLSVIEACAEAGIERVCFNLPSSEVEETTQGLDQLTALIGPYL